MNYNYAIARTPGDNFASGLTTAELGQPDYHTMLRQHRAYVQALRSLGLEVTVLDPLPDFPDAYFVEDPAVVFDEAAIITRPGAEERRGEAEAIEMDVAKFRVTTRIYAPGTLDGGDVLQVGRHFFIGLSERTNREGAEQFGKIVETYGYTWSPIPVEPGKLHLKSSVAWLGEARLLVSPYLAGREELQGCELVVRDEGETYASNVLLINGSLLIPTGCPATKAKLETLGLPVIELDNSEARKMDGALSCMSLRFTASSP
jgi:dimethylargininase